MKKFTKNILLAIFYIILLLAIYHFVLAKDMTKNTIDLYLQNINVNKEEI